MKTVPCSGSMPEDRGLRFIYRISFYFAFMMASGSLS